MLMKSKCFNENVQYGSVFEMKRFERRNGVLQIVASHKTMTFSNFENRDTDIYFVDRVKGSYKTLFLKGL